MKTICVIPARYASNRLPGKPLALIGGKPMIQWVYERASAAEKIDRVMVATDHPDIKSVVEKFGGIAVLTDSDLPSGTDRVAAATETENVDVIINLQGDEPFISPDLLNKMVDVFHDDQIMMATPIKKILTNDELINPNLVRVVRDKQHFALYFTRSVIPYLRDEKNRENWLDGHEYYKHIGIYAYRKEFLKIITGLQESPLEKAERLEQLRVLENGYKIYTVETEYESHSVDTREDLLRVNKLVKDRTIKSEF
ncbi:MAG: 3-deoxy-manno-octulosonate cytidylyltransferase [Calditrichaceae bacterium]